MTTYATPSALSNLRRLQQRDHFQLPFFFFPERSFKTFFLLIRKPFQHLTTWLDSSSAYIYQQTLETFLFFFCNCILISRERMPLPDATSQVLQRKHFPPTMLIHIQINKREEPQLLDMPISGIRNYISAIVPYYIGLHI